MASSTPMAVAPASMPDREQKFGRVLSREEAPDREHFEAGTLRESERESPARDRKWIRFIALTRSANLNTCKQCCNAFLRGMHFRHHGGRDRRQSASAASESV